MAVGKQKFVCMAGDGEKKKRRKKKKMATAGFDSKTVSPAEHFWGIWQRHALPLSIADYVTACGETFDWSIDTKKGFEKWCFFPFGKPKMTSFHQSFTQMKQLSDNIERHPSNVTMAHLLVPINCQGDLSSGKKIVEKISVVVADSTAPTPFFAKDYH